MPGHAGAGAAAALSITYGATLAGILAVALWHRRREEKPGASVQFDLEELPPAAE